MTNLRRPLGWCLLVGGCVALLSALIGTVVVWVVVGDAQRSSQQALQVTDQALASVSDSLVVASDVVTTVRTAMTTVDGGLDDISAAVGATGGALTQLQGVAGVLPTSLNTAADAVRSLTGVADAIDQSLTVLSRAPLIPDYDPSRSFGTLVRQLDQALTPLAAATQDLSGQLDDAVASGTAVQARLGDLGQRLDEVDAALGQAEQQLTTYRATADEARAVATATRHNLDRDLLLIRLVLVPLGIGLALGQLLPIWFGCSLLWPQRWRLPEPPTTRTVGEQPGESGLLARRTTGAPRPPPLG